MLMIFTTTSSGLFVPGRRRTRRRGLWGEPDIREFAMADGHLVYGAGGHLKYNSSGHLANTCGGCLSPTLYVCTFSGIQTCCGWASPSGPDISLQYTAASLARINSVWPAFQNQSVDGIVATGHYLTIRRYNMPPYPDNFPANCTGAYTDSPGWPVSVGAIGSGASVYAALNSYSYATDALIYDGASGAAETPLNNLQTACDDGGYVKHGFGGTCTIHPICTVVSLNGRGPFDSPDTLSFTNSGGSGSFSIAASGEWYLGKVGAFNYPEQLDSPYDTEGSDITWFSLTSASNGSGNATATFTVSPNGTGYSRGAGFVCNNMVIYVQQSA